MVDLKDFDILVTGARGLMGHALLQHLTSLKLYVKAFVRTLPESLVDGVEYYQGSLPDQIPDFQLNPDKKLIVFHFANCLEAKDHSLYDLVNVHGTKMLIEHLKGQIHTFVYASSMSVYGQGPFRKIDEDAQKNPETFLAQSRFKAEQIITKLSQEKDFNALLMRPRFILGDRDRSTFPALEKTAKYPFSIGNESQEFSFIGTDDYAQIMIALVDKHLQGTKICEAYNIAYPKPLSLKTMLTLLLPMRKPRRIKLPVKSVIFFLRILNIKIKLRTQLQLIGLDQVLSTKKLERALPEFCQQWREMEVETMKRLIAEYKEYYEKGYEGVV